MTFPRAERAGLRNISVVKDPELRAKLTPTHSYGCKRPLISNDYYPMFNRPNVEAVTEKIGRVTPTAVETVDGRTTRSTRSSSPTGFKVSKYLASLDVTGRNGLAIADAGATAPRPTWA